MTSAAFLLTAFAAGEIGSTSAAAAANDPKTLILVGRVDEARVELETLGSRRSDDVETLFLLGMIAIEQDQPRVAIDRFRAALMRAPNAIRIRLELARAFYMAHDYDNAFRQFQRARAGNPPAEVIATIDRFMSSIRRDKKWSYHLGLAVAPDSNINAATSAREAVLFGVPFELNDDARRKSGVGLAIESRSEFAPRIGADTRLRMAMGFDRREYSGRRFDDSLLTGEAGPTIASGRWEASLLASGFKRWYGRTGRINGAGLRAEATYYPDSRTALPIGLSVQRIRYANAPAYDSTLFSLQAGAGRALSPSSVVALRAGVSRLRAKAGFASNRLLSLGLSWSRDLPAGFTVRAEPLIAKSGYDALDPFAQVRRSDLLKQVSLSLLNRRVVLSGFTPRISYTLARRDSSAPLYAYRRRRLEFGFTSDF